MTPMLLNNRYQVLQTLGSGGFGTTYLAEDTQIPSRRKCVIKQLKPIANNPEVYQLVQERFQREAAILEELGDVNTQIPRLYAYFTEAGEFYLIQEWIEGMTLNRIVQANGAQPETTVREILIHLLPVLSYVHERRIVHRDIKPDNIILRQRDRQPVLIDFGAVRETMGTVVTSQGNSANSIVIGTPGFMPSEQAAGRPIYSSDLYSLALTMIYLLTAKLPQDFESDAQTGEIVWRRDARQISPAFADVLDKAIQYHPRDRYATAQEMLAALQRLAVVPPTTASTPLPSTQLDVPMPPVTSVPPTVLPHAPQVHRQPARDFAAAPSGDPNYSDPNHKETLAQIQGWNWGAFLLPGFWSLGNRVWVGLLAWSGPITGSLGWWAAAGVLGVKGNEWAWKSRQWRSVEAFKKTQRNWAIGGAITWGSMTALIIAAGIYGSQHPETQGGSSSSVSTPSNTSSETTTTLFGSKESLSEPTDNLDGTWQLSFTRDNQKYNGTLTMQGKTGTLVTQFQDAGGQRTVRQTMRLWSASRGLVVLGYNPIDQSTQKADPNYAADNLLFEQQAGSTKVTNCSDQGVCTSVTAQRVSGGL